MMKYFVIFVLSFLYFNPLLALSIKPYTMQEMEQRIKSGELFFVHFHAEWCPTCRVQAEIYKKIANDANLSNQTPTTILIANNDTETKLKLVLHVTSQSVLIGFANGQEISRTIGVTSVNKIMDQLAGQKK